MHEKGDRDEILRAGAAGRDSQAEAQEVPADGPRGTTALESGGAAAGKARAAAGVAGQGGVVVPGAAPGRGGPAVGYGEAGGDRAVLKGDGTSAGSLVPEVVVQAPEVVEVGGKKMAAVYLEPSAEDRKAGKVGAVVEFSPQEALILKHFLDSGGDCEVTAAAVGIKKDSVQRILRRPNLKSFLNTIHEQAAIDTATTPRWVVATARKVADGQTIPEQSWDAVKFIGKRLWPEKETGATPPGGQVNIQNNFYTTLGKEKINAEWAARGIRR